MLKIIDNNHYHVWTDALHARALSHQANNKWDRGTYVRWTVITAWIALEIACQDALQDSEISRRFKENLNDAIKKRAFPEIDWGQGVWQKVLTLQKLRINCIHLFSLQSDLFPDASMADDAIEIVRQAIIAIYNHVGKNAPHWIKDDTDQGWANKGGLSMFGNAYTMPPGIDENAPDTIKIAYIYKDKECIRDVLHSATDPKPYVDKLMETIGLPISAIKVYRGKEVIQEIQFPMDAIRGT